MAQGMMSDADLAAMPALTLAYIGDAVFELAVREHFLASPKHDNGTLHKTALNLLSSR